MDLGAGKTGTCKNWVIIDNGFDLPALVALDGMTELKDDRIEPVIGKVDENVSEDEKIETDVPIDRGELRQVVLWM